MTCEDPVRATAHGASRPRNVPMGGHAHLRPLHCDVSRHRNGPDPARDQESRVLTLHATPGAAQCVASARMHEAIVVIRWARTPHVVLLPGSVFQVLLQLLGAVSIDQLTGAIPASRAPLAGADHDGHDLDLPLRPFGFNLAIICC